MSTTRRASPPARRRRRIAIALVTFLVAGALAWSVTLVVRARDVYAQVKAGGRGWRGDVHEADAWLGLRPKPGGSGAETYPIGPDVPSRIDAQGFRVPLDHDSARDARRPLVLGLGCSFTYGSSVLAEHTFTWLVAEKLGGSARNAGICSAGAAQMLIRARELVPALRPDWVLVQDSPWLLERSRQLQADIAFGRLCAPHFVRASDGIELRPPATGTIVFDLPLAEYRDTPAGWLDFASFLARAGLPLLAHDDWHGLRLALWPRAPFATAEEIAAFVYPEIARICRENGARLVVVNLDARPPDTPWTPPRAIAELGVPLAAGGQRLVDELPEKTRAAYLRAYTLQRGDPPVTIDGHPNERAHALIADEILRVIAAAR